jgi:hypothetical protein
MAYKIEYKTIGGNRFKSVVRVPDPPKPRTFSKYKVVSMLTEMGIWKEVRDYIVVKDLYDLFMVAQDFKEDDKYFVEGLELLKTKLNISDEQVAAILKACEV